MLPPAFSPQEGFVFRPRLEDTINICAFKCSWNMRVGRVSPNQVER